jgi:hypothetical protein
LLIHRGTSRDSLLHLRGGGRHLERRLPQLCRSLSAQAIRLVNLAFHGGDQGAAPQGNRQVRAPLGVIGIARHHLPRQAGRAGEVGGGAPARGLKFGQPEGEVRVDGRAPQADVPGVVRQQTIQRSNCLRVRGRLDFRRLHACAQKERKRVIQRLLQVHRPRQ